jgi:poly(hydroxyalkanoate) depolymerase family esterase
MLSWRRMKRSFGVGFAIVVAACGSGPSGTGTTGVCPPKTKTADLPGAGGGAGGIQEVTSFGDNPGALQMFVHAPAGGHASSVIVAMHGCTQQASDYVSAGWNDVADKAGAVVVYPQQTSANDPMHCFTWWDPAKDATSIVSMVSYAKQTYGAQRAFVTGLSAGAAMTAAVLALHPDVFEAGAIMSGLPYACATSQIQAYQCMNPGKDQTPQAWAALVPASTRANPPRVAIWHGDADYVVNPTNEVQLVRQWTGVASISDTPSATETVGPATHATYKDSSGAVRVESWLIKGMSHGTALAPSQGCGKAGAYLLDVGICSTEKAADFFFGFSGGGSGGQPGSPQTPGGCP